MASIIKVDTIKDTGSNDIITSDGAGNVTLNASLSGFTSTGIDDNATSNALTLDSSSNLQFNSGYGSVATAYGCRFWVNFNGTGTVAIRASGNVSSITDNGTGIYWINLATAMPDVNYATANSNPSDLLSTGGQQFAYSQVTIESTSRCDLNVRKVDNDNNTFTQEDSSFCYVVGFR